MDRQERVIQSFLTVYSSFDPIIIIPARFEETFLPVHPDGEKVFVKTDTLYFIEDSKVIFDKAYQELGIDLPRHITDSYKLKDTLDYLRPILENLIREHVQPQGGEREEQEP
jgi:hypothetical protein